MTKQDYGTPWELIRAIEGRFGPIVCDLAAHAENAKCSTYISKEEDTFRAQWAKIYPDGNLWLNPEFTNIRPYAAKCKHQASKRNGLILMLTPSSIGSRWYHEYVHGNAYVLSLTPRVTFEGESDAFNKDCMISIFGLGGLHGFNVWHWKG